MQFLLKLFLVVIVIALVTFAVAGLMQWRRRVILGRKANEMALRFSVDDPFDIPGQHAQMTLFGSGHSVLIQNVTYGHLLGLPVRVFDLCYEVGHGTRLMIRRYSAFLAKLPQDVAPLLAWQQAEGCNFPGDADGQIGFWSFVGPLELAEAVADSNPAPGGCFQTLGNTLMIAVPQEKRSDHYHQVLEGMLVTTCAFLRASGIAVPGEAIGVSVPVPPADA